MNIIATVNVLISRVVMQKELFLMKPPLFKKKKSTNAFINFK